jgi:hypothetical protein
MTDDNKTSRRKFLRVGGGLFGAVVIGGVVGVELVDHGVLPGQSLLNQIDGACQVAAPKLNFGPEGQSINGSFHSVHRGREIGYSIGLPFGHRPGSETALAIFLHGEFATHLGYLGVAKTPARAVALMTGEHSSVPMAIATIDGGDHYWHNFHGDDPMAMVLDEFIPLCQSLGLGVASGSIGVMGLSMGGYGALLFAENHPSTFRAVAALSPAIWTSYSQARGANGVAYSSMDNFARYDVVTHASSLAGTPTFLASGDHDPFYPGALAFHAQIPKTTPLQTIFGKGCHGGSFYTAHMPAALTFMRSHLGASLG